MTEPRDAACLLCGARAGDPCRSLTCGTGYQPLEWTHRDRGTESMHRDHDDIEYVAPVVPAAARRWLVDAETAGLEHSANKGIAKNAEGLWFWCEAGNSAYGPYATLPEVLRGIEGYVHWLQGDA